MSYMKELAIEIANEIRSRLKDKNLDPRQYAESFDKTFIDIIVERNFLEEELLSKPKLDRYWIACYSASGREILEISKRLDRFPDRIITNQKDISKTVPELLAICEKKNIDFIQVINPTVESYRELFLPEALITLHGWSRIIPTEICEESEILNIHPGNTIKRNIVEVWPKVQPEHEQSVDIPIIIGKDPQRKALEIRAPYTGVTIHECSSVLDCGKVLAFKEVKNKFVNSFLTEEVLIEFINELREVSINLWIPILQKYLSYEQ